MKYTKKQMISMLIIGPLVIYPIMRFYFDLPKSVCIAIVILSEIVCILSFYYEKRSVRKYDKLKDDIENGTYEKSVDLRDDYLKFVNEQGFESVKHSSMKKDLLLRYFRPYSLFWIFFGVALLILNFIIVNETDLMLFLIIVSVSFIVFGISCIYPQNIRKFLKEYAAEYSYINNSYISGKQLTYKKTFASISDTSYNGGINLGSTYAVIFNAKEIAAIKYSDITKVNHRILSTKFYGNGLYTGTVYTHHVDITFNCRKTNKSRTVSTQLSEFQAMLTCETLNPAINPTEIKNNEINVNV